MGAEHRDEAIGKFVYGLVLSLTVGLSLRGISKFLAKKKGSQSLGRLVDCILFDANHTDRANSTSTTRGIPREPSNPHLRSPTFAWISDIPAIQKSAHLTFCAIGLIVSFLVYGIQQEKIMTSEYNGEKFRNPNFLIFCNRFVAMCIAIGVCYCKDQLRPRAALYKFSFCSISNILSSFCQFASLQFLSFPVLQVAKSCKTIAVLVVSHVVLGKRFPMFEYIVATVVAGGAGTFFYINAIAKQGQQSSNEEFNWSVGLLFLAMFILLDGFTNVWQGFLSKTYKTSQWQMMLGVNTFSMILTLLIQGTDNSLVETIASLTTSPSLLFDTIAFCISAVIGQLFIFHTIAEFGPLVFTLISIMRVILSIVTSCLIYKHSIVPLGWLCIFVVFGAMIYRAKMKNDLNKGRKKTNTVVDIQKLRQASEESEKSLNIKTTS
ncbi:hypothetical protein AAMO2058_000225700 [Amorphochlora amoebiformis]|uniref:Sugar phosphate transporter domain-containing protein n=1 Tax=Amorphochlora amoebiformis TaxID=1561963 RepID=A0A7S0H6E5_9EUKA|mmetsp:Transcript_33136/g.53230  ORF Transcript_33136/g.53230 Transcript_33136/m.53230 type:complete len:435 (+) Transcript_33136:40-1344(+)